MTPAETIEEAREALDEARDELVNAQANMTYAALRELGKPNYYRAQKEWATARMNFDCAVDAYAQAAELRGHVGACQWTKLTEHSQKDGRCGDGWYCDKAKAIQQGG